MIVQIYTVQSAEEALALADLGVDRIGITPSRCGLPGEVSTELARDIFAALDDQATKVALSVDSDLEAIAAMVDEVRPDVLHLCGDVTVVTPAQVERLRTLVGEVEIMQAVAVTDARAVQLAVEFAAVADSLILDSYTEEIGGIGAVGAVHDWRISAQIVRAVDVPVILAGGLTPENVAEAIAVVRPWGVDSLTHTNVALPGGGFRKDVDRVAAFVRAARTATPAGEPVTAPA
jgi:phosphoribosylanthranilate isomerase